MSEIARRTSVTVNYEGVNITKDLSEDLLSFEYTDSTNQPDEISITVKDENRNWIGAWKPLKGDQIEAKIISYDNNEFSELDCGIFYLDDKNFSGWPVKFNFKATSFDITIAIKNETKTKVWQKTSLKKIAQSIASTHKLSFKFQGKDTEIQEAHQSEQSDGGFLLTLCVNHGYAIKLIKKELRIIELNEIDSLEAVLVFEESFVENWSINETDNDTYDKCNIHYYDKPLGKKINEEVSVKRPGYKGATGKILKFNKSFGVKGTEQQKRTQLKKIASAKLREKNQEELTISFTTMGSTEIQAGRTFKIKGFGVYDDEKWIINTTKHSYSGSGYKVSVEGRRCLDI